MKLTLLDAVWFVNVWLLEDEGRRFIIDSGHALERPLLNRALRRAGIKPGDLTAVILTHRHSDHAGNARWIRDKFRCPVICHASDARVLSGAEPAPPLSRRGAALHEDILCRFEDVFPARSPVDDTFDKAGTWKWGFDIIPTAGHTAGSVMLYHAPSASLFSGDAILASPMLLRSVEGLRPAKTGFSLDTEACHRAVDRYLDVMPRIDTLCAGHGPAVRHGVREKLLDVRSRMLKSA